MILFVLKQNISSFIILRHLHLVQVQVQVQVLCSRRSRKYVNQEKLQNITKKLKYTFGLGLYQKMFYNRTPPVFKELNKCYSIYICN